MRAERDFVVLDDPHVDTPDARKVARAWLEEALPERLKGPDDPAREVERLLAIGEPSLKSLSHVLRHQELWPAGFEWNYGGCDTCAMGLANNLWEEHIIYPDSGAMSRAFDINLSVAGRIFGGNDMFKTYGVDYYNKITPEMVADKIDEYLATVANASG